LAQAPESGALVVWSDGSFIYWPEVHFEGTTEFVIEISDGSLITAVTYRVEVVRPKILPPNFGIPAETGPPLHALTPEERAENTRDKTELHRPELKESAQVESADRDGVLAISEEERVAELVLEPRETFEPLEFSVPERAMKPIQWLEIRSNFDWNAEWYIGQRARYQLDLQQGRLPELRSYEVDVFELEKLGLSQVGPWELESFDWPQLRSSHSDWAPALTSHLELTISLGATAAWLVFHGRMLAVAAAATALRDAVDPTQLLEQAVDADG
ncbi:MAG: hypothetical protein JNL67_03215, partial [Planctomycetaceae bacterium]|nr:hypothetical protein [Planctomycetaceae bacterium]